MVNKNGELIFSTDPFEPRFYYFSLNQETKNNSSYVSSKYKEIFSAITLNLQDYLIKSNLSKNVIVALSGGIDSAVTLVLCVKSLGPEKVTAIYLPSKFSDSNNLKYSKELCETIVSKDQDSEPGDDTKTDRFSDPKLRKAILTLENEEAKTDEILMQSADAIMTCFH